MDAYTFRNAGPDEFVIVSTFPQNAKETFYISPSMTYPPTPEKLEQIASTRWHPTVVLDGEQVAGYANMYGYEPDQHAWLGNFILNPAYRGKGAAQALLAEMVRKAGEELRVPKLKLVCHNTNMAALLFYEKLGFKPFDLKRMKNEEGETIVGIHMELSTAGAE